MLAKYLWPDATEPIYICALPLAAYGNIAVQDPPADCLLFIAKELVRNSTCAVCGLASVSRPSVDGTRRDAFGVCSRECAKTFHELMQATRVAVTSSLDGKPRPLRQSRSFSTLVSWQDSIESRDLNVGVSVYKLWRNVCEWLGLKCRAPAKRPAADGQV